MKMGIKGQDDFLPFFLENILLNHLYLIHLMKRKFVLLFLGIFIFKIAMAQENMSTSKPIIDPFSILIDEQVVPKDVKIYYGYPIYTKSSATAEEKAAHKELIEAYLVEHPELRRKFRNDERFLIAISYKDFLKLSYDEKLAYFNDKKHYIILKNI